LKYFGTLTNKNCSPEENKSTLEYRNAYNISVQNSLSSYLFSKNIKIKNTQNYNFAIVVLYGCET
jgi:hypothetical protein